jgi:hypothetical protein
MKERAYTISEIDAMRTAVRSLMTKRTYFSENRNAWAETCPDEDVVENRLRTYMMAGVDPADLKAKAEIHSA